MPAVGGRGAAVGGRGATGFIGWVTVKGWVTAPASTRGAEGAAGRGADGAPGAAGRGTEGAIGGRGADGGAVAAGGGGASVGVTCMVLRPGGGIGAGGSETGLVEALGEGGGSGADGSWIGAEARFTSEEEGGGKLPVVPPIGTGAVASRGCTAPAPGRARRVMRTVSFFSGTAEVFAALGGGIAAVLGVGGVFSSLMERSGSGKVEN